MGKGYILVEGHGELGAVDNLIARLSRDLGTGRHWADAIRWPNLHLRTGVEKGAGLVRAKPDAEGLLLIRDEDDACPAQRGPLIADWLRQQQLPFPAAVVLLHPEYEVLFLPCLPWMVGKTLGTGALARPGLRAETIWQGGWENRRGIKEWLSAQFPPNRSYKPTLDQLEFTRRIEFEVLRRAQLPCFGTLERAVTFLHTGRVGAVYPPSRGESLVP